MEPHLVAEFFFVSGVGLEHRLQITVPQYMDEADDRINPFYLPIQLFALNTLPQSYLRPDQ